MQLLRLLWLGTATTIASGVASAQADTLEVGLGVAVLGAHAGLGEPDGNTALLPRSGDTVSLPALSGQPWGGGIQLEVRALEMVGVELDGFISRDFLSGELTRNGAPVEVSIGQTAFHFPLLLKGLLSLGPVTLHAGAGPEYVINAIPSAEADPDSLRVVASADPYTAVTASLGAELALDSPVTDFRFPASLRFSWVPSVSDKQAERVTVLPTDALILESVPAYQISLVLGMSTWF